MGLKRIYPGAFDNKTELRAIDISDNKDLEDLPDLLFANLNALEYLNLPGHQLHRLCSLGFNTPNSSLLDEFSMSFVASVFIDGVKQPNIDCQCHYANFSARGFCIPTGKAHSAGTTIQSGYAVLQVAFAGVLAAIFSLGLYT